MENIIALKRKLYESDSELKRKQIAQKLYDYYIGDEDWIFAYLKAALRKTFDHEMIPEYQLNYVNVTRKIINALAIVYKEPPKRTLVHPAKDKESDEVKAMNKYYLDKLPLDANSKDKRVNRLARLFGRSQMQLSFDRYSERFKYTVEPNYLFTINPLDDDPYRHELLMYIKEIEGEENTIVWTDEDHYRIDSKDVIHPIGDNEGMVNPYGVIPFPSLLLEEGEDYWGNGLRDVVNANEQLNVLLTFFKNISVFLGTQGTVLAVNLGLETKGTKGENNPRQVRIGYQHPVNVENARGEMKDPKLEHVSFDPYITEVRDTIDWEIKRIAQIKGLNPNTILSQIKDTSDYQKMMDAVEQLEVRRDDIEPCRVFEKGRFEIFRTMNNVLAGTKEGKGFGLQVIPEEYELDVDFADVEIMKTPEDKQKEREFEYKYNLSTPKDWKQEDNPDLTDEEAEETINDNKEFNKSMDKQPTVVESLLKQRKEVSNAGEQ